jgi:hypothetical protein
MTNNIDKTIRAINDLKDIVASDFDKSLAEQTAIVKLQTAHETRDALNQEIKKLENFKILTNGDPALEAIGNRNGAADDALVKNQEQAVQILRVLEYFKNDPGAPSPALKSGPVVSVDLLRLVARCTVIAAKFENARPALTTAMLRGVPL